MPDTIEEMVEELDAIYDAARGKKNADIQVACIHAKGALLALSNVQGDIRDIRDDTVTWPPDP